MWIAVILGYFLSAAFAYCGVVNLAVYIAGVDNSTGYSLFVKGLPEAGWPLLAGMLLYVLIQIALLLEKQALLSSVVRPASPLKNHEDTPAHEKRRTEEKAAPQEVYFRIQPTPPLPGDVAPATPRPAPTPGSPAFAPTPEETQEELPTPPHEKAENEEKRRNLSFFRID